MINEESSAKSLFGQTHGACLNRQFKETYFLTTKCQNVPSPPGVVCWARMYRSSSVTLVISKLWLSL